MVSSSIFKVFGMTRHWDWTQVSRAIGELREHMKQMKRVKVVKRREQKEHLKQGDEQKQIYIPQQ